jgi:chitodextrinase
MPSRRSPSFWVAALVLAAILVPTTLAASTWHRSQSTRNTYNDRRPPKPVRDLEVAAADSSSVALDWSRAWDNVRVEGYGVYLDGSQTAQTRYSGYTLRDLACGKGYTVGVDAFDDAGNRSRKNSMFVSTSACRDVTPPSAPTGIQSAATTDTSVILSWAPSSDDFGVVGYGIYVGGFWVGRWSDPSATITNLSCGQDYEIGIDAVDATGNHSGRTTAFFSTAPCADHKAPSSPADLVVTKATQDTLSLGWTASTDASGIAEYGLYLDGTKVGNASSSTGDFTGLACGATHTFGVDAADTAQNRSAVATLTAATAPCSTEPPPSSPPPPSDSDVPTAPANLHSTSVTQTAVSLAWDSSSADDGMSGYQIFRDDEKIGEGPGVHGGFTNTWTDTSRSCGTDYDYAVAGVDKSGHVGPESTVTVTTAACDTQPTTTPPPPSSPPPPPATDSTAPTVPAGVTATTRTATSIALTWQASKDDVGVTGYGLYRGGSPVGTTAATTWIFSGLSCGTSYTLAVDAYDATGNRSSQGVAMVSTTTCADTQPPSAPTGLAVSNVTQTGAMLSWTAAKDNVGVTGYDVYRNGSKLGTATDLSSPQTALACNTKYTLAVAARDAAGNTSPQTQMSMTTAACSTTPPPPPPPPPPPTGQTGVVQLSGTVSASQFLNSVNAAPSGALTVQPAAGQSSFTVSGDVSNFTRANVTIQNMVSTGEFRINGSADNLTIDHASMLSFYTSNGLDGFTLENSTIDGQCRVAQNWMHGTSNFKILNNTIKNFHTCSNESNHSEGIFVAAYNHDGLIQGNTFTDNGTTGHLFFSWFDGSATDHSTYPHDICVTGNTFIRSLNGYYHIQFRNEFDGSENIDIDPSNVKGASISGYNTSLSTGYVRSC